MEKILTYEENQIMKNIQKYLKNILIIKRMNIIDMIHENIHESIRFCNIIEKALKNAIDINEDIDTVVIEILNEMIIIITCYNFTEEIREISGNEKINEFEKKINLLIREKIKELKMTI